MAFHCGAPTRDGSPCQRHVRDLATRCPQHRNLGGTALHPPRHAMRTIELTDPALTAPRTVWTSTRADEQRDRVIPPPSEESPPSTPGTQPTENEDDEARPIGPRSYLDRERSRRMQAEADGEKSAEQGPADAEPEHHRERPAQTEHDHSDTDAESELDRERKRRAPARHEHVDAGIGPERERRAQTEREPGDTDSEPERITTEPSALLTYLARERARRMQAARERADALAPTEPEAGTAEQLSALSYLSRQRAAENQDMDPEPDQAPEPESRPVEQRPRLRKERALDPDWIGGRPLFRDEAPTRPMPKIEFEPSEGRLPRRPPRVPPMRSVVLNPASEAAPPAVTPNGFAAEPDPPTLIDRMPPIAHDDLVVPDFLRPDFGAPAAAPDPDESRPPLPQRVPRPWPRTKAAKADPDPPTLIDPHPPITVDSQKPAAPAAAVPSAPPASARVAPADAPAVPVAPAAAAARPAPAPAATGTRAATSTHVAAAAPTPDDITVPDFVIPGFTQPAAKPPLRTVLSTVLGPELWQRCYVEWSPAHCTALARIARTVDGLAPSAGTAVRSTAGAGMRWLGVAREREMLADQVAAAISHPVGATAPNQARTVRLYGAAICMALNVPLRRCACHRDLDRDVSSELIRLGLEELAGEVN